MLLAVVVKYHKYAMKTNAYNDFNMHEDKCVNNRWWVLKTDYKKQTISVMFLLVATMFIVPVITEKALAITSGNAYLDIEGKFYNVRGHLTAGVFLRPFGYPRILPGGDIITWATGGTGIYGNEGGYVSPMLLVCLMR
jgi:hypothetical protein